MPSTAADAEGSRRIVATVWDTAATMLIVDVATKALAVGLIPSDRSISIIGGRMAWVVQRNPGAALSFGADHTWALTVLVAAVVCVVSRYAGRADSRLAAVGAGLFLGGALGNLGDRVFRAPGRLQGHVVDFMAIGGLPVFNAADVGIACGAVVLGWRLVVRPSVGQAEAVIGPAEPALSNSWSWVSRV